MERNIIQNIISTLTRYFINACSLTLILMMFANNNLPFSVARAKIFVVDIMLIQITFCSIAKLCNHIFGLVTDTPSYHIRKNAKEIHAQPKNKEQNEKILDITCIHEAGHAFANFARPV